MDGNSLNFSDCDPHAVAGAIKKCLREKMCPLLTVELYEDFLRAVDGEYECLVVSVLLPHNSRTDPSRLRDCVDQLPEPNTRLLNALLSHLILVRWLIWLKHWCSNKRADCCERRCQQNDCGELGTYYWPELTEKVNWSDNRCRSR